MIFFQAPWLPEFMLAGGDYAFLEAAFKGGKIAPRTPGAITDEDVERCGARGCGHCYDLQKLSACTCLASKKVQATWDC